MVKKSLLAIIFAASLNVLPLVAMNLDKKPKEERSALYNPYTIVRQTPGSSYFQITYLEHVPLEIEEEGQSVDLSKISGEIKFYVDRAGAHVYEVNYNDPNFQLLKAVRDLDGSIITYLNDHPIKFDQRQQVFNYLRQRYIQQEKNKSGK